jgi:Spy/CpxP family protein refolding chaperone
MKKGLISVVVGLIFIVASALDAGAQMSGCMGGGMGGGMQGGGMMGGMGGGMQGGMGQKRMGMMHGAGGMQGEGMMDDDHPMWKHLMSLGLDDKQQDALRAIKSKAMKDAVRKKADKQIAKIELHDLLDKDTVDMKAVEALAKKIEGLKTEMFISHIKVKEEIKALLTPAQRKQLKDMMSPGHGMGGMGDMGGMGCGMMHGDGGQKEDQPAEKKEHHMMH